MYKNTNDIKAPILIIFIDITAKILHNLTTSWWILGLLQISNVIRNVGNKNEKPYYLYQHCNIVEKSEDICQYQKKYVETTLIIKNLKDNIEKFLLRMTAFLKYLKIYGKK